MFFIKNSPNFKRFYLVSVMAMMLASQHYTIGQSNRITTQNNLSWWGFFGTTKIANQWSLHTEYQLRRSEFLGSKQQNLLRLGLNYHLKPSVLFRVGYAHIETYPYGEIPLNSMGRDFTEHRVFEAVQLQQKEGVFDISHRFMLEQRFVGRYSNANKAAENEFPLLNRMRYQTRVQLPLVGTQMKDKIPYFAAQNEIFIGFGKNVNANVFDQNRLSFLLGYRFHKDLRIEAGYLSQILQYGRLIENKGAFQNNNAFVVNTFCNFDLTKKHQ